MVLKKPYLFFIRHFKFFNILLSLLISILIYNDDKIVKFLNKYIFINDTNISILDTINTRILIVVPVIICFFSIILLSIMFKKSKPIKFYLFTIFSFIAIIVINVHLIGFLNTISKEIVTVKYIKFSRDLKLISVILESISCIYLFIRGLGINIKKFDFSSDLLKFDLSDEDREEIEISLNINNDKLRKERKQKIDKYRYYYLENKFKINSIFIVTILIISSLFIYFYIKVNIGYKKENITYEYKDLAIKVNYSYYSNMDYIGNIISDNMIIIVDATMNGKNNILLNEFNLKINNVIFKPTKKYYKSFIDLGNGYNEKISTNETRYLIMFEVPKSYIKKKVVFNLYNINVKLSLLNLDYKEKEKIYSSALNNEVNFDSIYFNINSYEIQDDFALNYTFCHENGCTESVEHIKASIDENFDKTVLKLNVDTNINFLNFFKNYASIVYKINNTEYIQDNNFELLKPKKSESADIFIGINKNILNADSIKILFKKRDIKIEYILRGGT